MLQPISAPRDRDVKVTIYEPAQRADQEEVIIEEFDLKAGETRDYDFQSATAAFRTSVGRIADSEDLPMSDRLKEKVETMNREDEERLKEVNRGAFAERIDAEVNAGKKAHSANQKAYGGTERQQRKAEQHSEKERAGSVKDGQVKSDGAPRK